MSSDSLNWLLRALAVLVIAAAAVRGAGLIRSAAGKPPAMQDDLPIRELLALPPDHRVRRLMVSDFASRGTAVVWADNTGVVTAIVPDATGRLRIGHVFADAAAGTAEGISAGDLAAVDHSDWPALPPRFERLAVSRWDPAAAVFITVGPDGRAGIAGVDDDGDGVVDDLGELGATGSDDAVIAPGQAEYAEAAAGEVVARVISRGALIGMEGDRRLPSPRADRSASGDAAARRSPEVWLEFSGSPTVEPVRICLQVH